MINLILLSNSGKKGIYLMRSLKKILFFSFNKKYKIFHSKHYLRKFKNEYLNGLTTKTSKANDKFIGKEILTWLLPNLFNVSF